MFTIGHRAGFEAPELAAMGRKFNQWFLKAQVQVQAAVNDRTVFLARPPALARFAQRPERMGFRVSQGRFFVSIFLNTL